MADERENMARISSVAVDLVTDVSGRIEAAVAAVCGVQGDLVRYIVGTALVAVGAGIMKRFYATATLPYSGEGAENEALHLVRGVFKDSHDGT